MENYRLLERLGKGGQGSVYLAENKEENKKYVMKKIECSDESEANTAFHEGLILRTLCHPYICGYKEFFVFWDKEESSMYICIVMDYYPKGDLCSIITDYRDRKEPMPEKMIKRYFGETLDALGFVHSKGVIHRDVKPSNIFLKDDGTSCLGDFGVSTFMSDKRTSPRNPAGTTRYMAPEVMTQAFDDRSDIWSLGCVIFEMLTTFFCTQNEVAEMLTEMKKDTYILEEIYEKICSIYPNDWVKTLRCMLKTSHEARPNTGTLMKIGFVNKCVKATDSLLLDKRRRREQTANRIRPLPEDLASAESIILYIADTIDHKDCVKEGLEALRNILQAEIAAQEREGSPQPRIFLDQPSKNLITLAMWDNPKSAELQAAGLACMTALVLNADPSDVLFTPEPMSVISKMMKLHQNDQEVQQNAAALILALSSHSGASSTIGKLGGVEDLVTAMRNYPDNKVLVATCCSALWILAIDENNADMAGEQNAIQQVFVALRTHLKSPEVVEAATAAMVSLTLDDRCFSTMNDQDGVGILLEALNQHNKNAKIVKNICMVLAALVEPNEECAYRMLTSEDPQDDKPTGIPILIEAYKLHRDNAELVEAIVTVFMELSEYNDIVVDLNSYSVVTQLKEIRAKYLKNKDVLKPCEAALEKLGVGKNITAGQSVMQTT